MDTMSSKIISAAFCTILSRSLCSSLHLESLKILSLKLRKETTICLVRIVLKKFGPHIFPHSFLNGLHIWWFSSNNLFQQLVDRVLVIISTFNISSNIMLRMSRFSFWMYRGLLQSSWCIASAAYRSQTLLIYMSYYIVSFPHSSLLFCSRSIIELWNAIGRTLKIVRRLA